jgi:hypothetical protein
MGYTGTMTTTANSTRPARQLKQESSTDFNWRTSRHPAVKPLNKRKLAQLRKANNALQR